MRLLIVDDDPALRDVEQRAASSEGYEVQTAATAGEALAMLHADSFDGIVLDLTLPDGSGLDVLAALRNRGDQTPVLCVTGSGDDATATRVLDAGADDFVAKPINRTHFLARIRALLRRRTEDREPLRVQVGNVVVDRAARKVSVGAHTLVLTQLEFLLVSYFVARAGVLVTRAELLREIWGIDFEPGTNSIDVHLSRVRRQLGAAGATPMITTMRSRGFVLETPTRSDSAVTAG